MSIRSFGLRIYVDGVAIAGLRDTTPPSPEASIIDVTTHDSPSNAREFMGGMIDGGTLTINGLYDYDDAGQAALFGGIGTEALFHVVYSDGSGVMFTGNIQNFGDANPLDDAVGFSSPIKVTGDADEFAGTYYVTGTLTVDGSTPPELNPLTFSQILNDRPAFDDYTSGDSLGWSGLIWALTANGAVWTSSADVVDPGSVSILYPGPWHSVSNPNGWKPTSPATGTPVVTAILPT